MLKGDNNFSVEDYNEEYYEFLSAKYITGERSRKIRSIANYAGNVKGLKVLDAGCGPGFISRVLLEMGAEVYSLDFSPNAIRKAKENHHDKLTLIRGDVSNLPFRENMFDVVYATDLIEHLYDGGIFLEETYRVLKPGGRLVLNTDNAWYQQIIGYHTKLGSMLKEISRFNLQRFYWAAKATPKIFALDNESRHVYIYSPKELRTLMLQLGFEVKKLDTICTSASNDYLRKILALNVVPFGRLFKYLRSSLIILVEKKAACIVFF